LGDTIFSKDFFHESYLEDTIGRLYANDFQIFDSSIYVVGEEEVPFSDSTKIFIAKHSTNGNLIWHKSYGFKQFNRGQSIYLDSSTIYVGGEVDSYSSSDNEPIILKVDFGGLYQWHHIVPDIASTNNTIILKAQNQFYAVGGTMPSNTGTNNYKVHLSKFNSSGTFDSPFFLGGIEGSVTNVAAIINSQNNLVVA